MSVILALLLGAVVEFGFLFSHKLELTNASRSGARWASLHSTSWSAVASPDSNTIEGQVRAAGGTSLVPNDDQHIAIEYFSVVGATQTLCGQYRVTGAAFSPAAGYSQATCVIPRHLLRATPPNSHPLPTQLLCRRVRPSLPAKAFAVLPVLV